MIPVLLDHKFLGSPAGKDSLEDKPEVRVFQVGDDETGVGSHGIVSHLGNDSAVWVQGLALRESQWTSSRALLLSRISEMPLGGERDLKSLGGFPLSTVLSLLSSHSGFCLYLHHLLGCPFQHSQHRILLCDKLHQNFFEYFSMILTSSHRLKTLLSKIFFKEFTMATP